MWIEIYMLLPSSSKGSSLSILYLCWCIYNFSCKPSDTLLTVVAAMDASQPLSIDSFSYSWLVNLKPSLENPENSFGTSLDASDETSFIEMDPKMPPSKRFFRNSQDFKFDFPVSPSALSFVHADQLISNGHLMPLFFDPVKVETFEDSDFVPSLSNSSHVAKDVDQVGNSDCSSLRKCRKLSKQILQKYLNFLVPLCRRISGVRTSSKAAKFGKRSQSVKNLKQVYSSETSPRVSVAYSADDWRKSCDSESSIYEAVLHCKRSIGK